MENICTSNDIISPNNNDITPVKLEGNGISVSSTDAFSATIDSSTNEGIIKDEIEIHENELEEAVRVDDSCTGSDVVKKEENHDDTIYIPKASTTYNIETTLDDNRAKTSVTHVERSKEENIDDIFDSSNLEDVGEVLLECQNSSTNSINVHAINTNTKYQDILKLESARPKNQKPSKAKKKRKPVIKPKILLECYKCGQKTYSKPNLMHHLKTGHVWERTCWHCNKAFRHISALNYHLTKIKNKYICAICGKKTSTREDLIKHIRSAHYNKGNEFKCDTCEFGCKTRTAMNYHKKAKHSGKIFKCEICDYISCNERLLKRHVHYKHKKEPMECQEEGCNFKSPFAGIFRTHMKEKHMKNAEEFYCIQCSYKSTSKANLAKHIRNCHQKCETLSCVCCTFKTKSKKDLRSHFRYEHDETIKPKKCPYCLYENKRTHNVTSHIRRNHDESVQWHKCTECDFESRSKFKLGQHMSQKHGPKAQVYKCSKCPYKSGNRNWFMAHFKRRHGEITTWHSCTECKFKTKYRHCLKNHLKNMHQKNLECFICSDCRQVFNDKYTLEHHIFKDHRKYVKVLECPFCDLKYMIKISLDSHLLLKHRKRVHIRDVEYEWRVEEPSYEEKSQHSAKIRARSKKHNPEQLVEIRDTSKKDSPEQFKKVLKVVVERLDFSRRQKKSSSFV